MQEELERRVIAEAERALGTNGVSGLQLIQDKAGIAVYRARLRGNSVIVKYISDPASRREIANYALLHSLGVQTLPVLGASERCLCLEDLVYSERLRLGAPHDLEDPAIARLISRWYRELHARGEGDERLPGLYSESDLITVDALIALRARFPQAALTCDLLLGNLDTLCSGIAGLDATLTYNDFYWTNLAVSRDLSGALMFDYNLLGRGYRYGDVRNVCSSLSASAGAAFQQAYGYVDAHEIAVDAVVAPLVGLITAAARPSFPSWAEDALRSACDGRLLRAAQQLV